jgi:hypothetical protein
MQDRDQEFEWKVLQPMEAIGKWMQSQRHTNATRYAAACDGGLLATAS